MKKELEKSAQALDAATVDLQNKIQENGMSQRIRVVTSVLTKQFCHHR
jgi:hypothetical protein